MEASRLAEKMVKYYSQATPAASSKWLDETRNTPYDPIKRALDANDVRIARIQESIRNKTWEKAMSTRTKEDWLASVDEEAARRFSSSTGGKGLKKYAKKAPKLAAVLLDAKRKSDEIKKVDLEAAIRRVRVVVETLKAAKGTI